MKQIYPDLWQSVPEHPFFGVVSHAYLLTKTDGNILFYGTGNVEYEKIDSLGGICFQFLSHRDEAGASIGKIRDHFNSKVFCHRLEAPVISRYTIIDGFFEEERASIEGIDVVPTPGHTDGSVCFFVRSPFGKNYLFTGDTIFMNDGDWAYRINRGDGGSRESLIRSLGFLKGFSPDVVIFSGSVGRVALKEVTAEEWQNAIDSLIKSLSEP